MNCQAGFCVIYYIKTLSDTVVAKKQAAPYAYCKMEEDLIEKLSKLTSSMYEEAEILEQNVVYAKSVSDKLAQAECYKDTVLSKMEEIRAISDKMEIYTPKDVWPFPTYGDLLFSIQ